MGLFIFKIVILWTCWGNPIPMIDGFTEPLNGPKYITALIFPLRTVCENWDKPRNAGVWRPHRNKAMAFERALQAATSTNFLTNPQIPSLSPNTTTNHNRLSFARRRFSFKCAVEYSRDHYSGSVQVPVAHPRPAEVPWKKELCNTVHLIGVVGLPVEIKHLPSGKVLAWTRLAVKKSASDTSWYYSISPAFQLNCRRMLRSCHIAGVNCR